MGKRSLDFPAERVPVAETRGGDFRVLRVPVPGAYSTAARGSSIAELPPQLLPNLRAHGLRPLHAHRRVAARARTFLSSISSINLRRSRLLVTLSTALTPQFVCLFI